jgi:hypothetical protein
LLFSSSAGAGTLAGGVSGGGGGILGITPSFNSASSGRSSNCDEHDLQSDISLEEDVNDLNQKVGFECISTPYIFGAVKKARVTTTTTAAAAAARAILQKRSIADFAHCLFGQLLAVESRIPRQLLVQ